MRFACVFFGAMAACKGRAVANGVDAAPPPVDWFLTIDAGEQQLSISGPSLVPPADWPADVPVYPGSHISQIGVEDGGASHEMIFETNDSIAKVDAFYRRAFSGMPKIMDIGMMGVRTLVFKDGTKAVSIVLANVIGRTQVTLAVQPP